jgi:hypothetical protein
MFKRALLSLIIFLTFFCTAGAQEKNQNLELGIFNVIEQFASAGIRLTQAQEHTLTKQLFKIGLTCYENQRVKLISKEIFNTIQNAAKNSPYMDQQFKDNIQGVSVFLAKASPVMDQSFGFRFKGTTMFPKDVLSLISSGTKASMDDCKRGYLVFSAQKIRDRVDEAKKAEEIRGHEFIADRMIPFLEKDTLSLTEMILSTLRYIEL